MIRLLLMIIINSSQCSSRINQDKRIRGLISGWAPLVWLAPGERFMPLSVPEFLEHVQAGDNYLRTRVDIKTLLANETSFLYGREPGTVPIYALVQNCVSAQNSKSLVIKRKRALHSRESRVISNEIPEGNNPGEPTQLISKGKRLRKLHFHVTYWMFYPFSEGKAVCVLDLGFFGTWPIPSVGGLCLGQLKEYGNHVGDWEHMSLYFTGEDHPVAMYVSAHDAGAYYRYDVRSGTFIYESQETRKGIFQKPIFPERVFTSSGSHPILFSAKGSHGLWTAPGKHKFVRIPRLYDESGFGTPWPTWKNLELIPTENPSTAPSWMSFTGKWGNPRSNCHPLVNLGFNICEFVDGPTGIPTKKGRFQCLNSCD
ncbi:GSCOCG00008084001-RA-CDS [Cotesia congregata]|nr:GSCOCG00008084001-RA-CDS [Cotesia congregata]